MFPLTTQLRFVAFQAQEPIYRLRGEALSERLLQVRQEGPDGGERPGTWTQARARLADAAAFLATVGADEFDAAVEMPIAHELPMGMIFDMTASNMSATGRCPKQDSIR
jgi:hypothetical protein